MKHIFILQFGFDQTYNSFGTAGSSKFQTGKEVNLTLQFQSYIYA